MESAHECRSGSIAQEKHKKCVLINCMRILIILAFLASFSGAESYETGQNKLSETYRRLKATAFPQLWSQKAKRGGWGPKTSAGEAAWVQDAESFALFGLLETASGGGLLYPARG